MLRIFLTAWSNGLCHNNPASQLSLFTSHQEVFLLPLHNKTSVFYYLGTYSIDLIPPNKQHILKRNPKSSPCNKFTGIIHVDVGQAVFCLCYQSKASLKPDSEVAQNHGSKSWLCSKFIYQVPVSTGTNLQQTSINLHEH